MNESDLTASISKNTVVKGDIATKDNLEIFGHVEGDVISKAVVKVYGVVRGKICCETFVASGAKICGDITCTHSVVVRTKYGDRGRHQVRFGQYQRNGFGQCNCWGDGFSQRDGVCNGQCHRCWY